MADEFDERIKRGTRVRVEWEEGQTFGRVTMRHHFNPVTKIWSYRVRMDGATKTGVPVARAAMTVIEESEHPEEPGDTRFRPR
jgi:hypothetical protein